jgi:hypothetical protein
MKILYENLEFVTFILRAFILDGLHLFIDNESVLFFLTSKYTGAGYTLVLQKCS